MKCIKSNPLFFGCLLIGAVSIAAMSFFADYILAILAATVPVVFGLALYCVWSSEVLPPDVPESFDIMSGREEE